MPGTLILKFHPGYQPSKVNAAMTQAVSGLPGVETVDMYARYPHEDDLKDAETLEVERLCAADRLCVQFPVHWFATTPRAMAWQEQETYCEGGENLYPLEELLRPWECTAN
jgi:glutathione-regulated potassium-efflux system ancillary protein KefG